MSVTPRIPGTLSASLTAQALTVEEAIRVARENNPGFRKVQNDALVADAEIRRSVGGLLPSLNARLDFSGTSPSRVTGENDYGQPVELPQAVDFKGSTAQQGINLGMTLFDGSETMRASARRRMRSMRGSTRKRRGRGVKSRASTTRLTRGGRAVEEQMIESII